MDATTKDIIRQSVKEAETKIKELESDIFTARKAGLDVVDYEKQLRDTKSKIILLKAAYGIQ